ncbi:sulfite reductase [Oleiphilus messinensis]|uniref:Sulfite reductase n=1 Tax=Oleiphilus messinensis TaxID=141451 RepID=A0A1Y0I7S4_9GAMM|nr:nitrite/sulfite reductase [Oleiphilus messinensis]ARU55494.1 sulfite reductase [Oleiphilus messinensis]
MYKYSAEDHAQLSARLALFQLQTERHLGGGMTDEQYRPLRLQNGLYLQRHAPMLRVAVPYGMLRADQLRCLAGVAKNYDKGYCHISTRQNVQFNWIGLSDIPNVLTDLSESELHSTQTSGNCIRNVTADPLAGVAVDEIADPRPFCEIIRQWSTGHPEFAFLPRKFKIAVSGGLTDRAMTEVHDIGLQIQKQGRQGWSFTVFVGGGLGRTPMVGKHLKDQLPAADLLDYLHAILRVYNRFGRRDNKYKARLKILVKALGIEAFRAQVNAEFVRVRASGQRLSADDIAFAQSFFPFPEYRKFDHVPEAQLTLHCDADTHFRRWVERNTLGHRVPGYRAVLIPLKRPGMAPGDITDNELLSIAELSERYSFGEVRTTPRQNLILADVPVLDLYPLWRELADLELAHPNGGTVSDVICCPGLDYCNLANAESISVSSAIQRRFDDLDYLHDVGDFTLNISGCVNACAHHHLADIGVLGVDKKGEQFYQVSLGGKRAHPCRIGSILGPAFSREQIPSVVELIVQFYVQHRNADECFSDVFDRLGISAFKERVYGRN